MPPRGAITQEDREFVEVWQNVSPVTNWITRLNPRGDELPEMVAEQRDFQITTEERILTESKILDEKNNPFKNGAFRPLITPPGIDIKTNPNALGDEDIRRLFSASPLAWDEWFKEVDSPATLRRMQEVAEALLDEGVDVSALRVRQVNERLAEKAPRQRVVQKDDAELRSIGGAGGGARKSMRAS